MKRTRVLLVALFLSIVIALAAWSAEFSRPESKRFGAALNNNTSNLPGKDNLTNSQNEFPLLAAVKENDLVRAKKLIIEGVDINRQNQSGATALWYAVSYGNLEMVDLLLESGADINNGSAGTSPLQVAAGRKDVELIKLLINKGADVKVKSSSGRTLLHVSASKGDIEAIKLLCSNGADVNAVDTDDRSPMIGAIYSRNADIIKLLIENHANINYGDKLLLTPLHHAVGLGFEEGVDVLLNHGADVQAKTKNDGLTPLHMAVINGRIKIIEMILQYNPDINAVNNRNQTVLNITCYRQITDASEDPALSREIATLLIDHGAQVSLHDAVLLEDVKKVKELLTKGANVEAKDSIQATALHHAVAMNQYPMVELLLQEGANPDIKSENGMTALDIAIAQGHKDIADLIKNHTQKDK